MNPPSFPAILSPTILHRVSIAGDETLTDQAKSAVHGVRSSPSLHRYFCVYHTCVPSPPRGSNKKLRSLPSQARLSLEKWMSGDYQLSLQRFDCQRFKIRAGDMVKASFNSKVLRSPHPSPCGHQHVPIIPSALPVWPYRRAQRRLCVTPNDSFCW